MDDAIERLRRLDPVPERLAPPPLPPLLSEWDTPRAHHGVDSRGHRPQTPWWGRRPNAGAAVAVASVAVAVAVVIGALVLLGQRDRSSRPMAPSAPRSSAAGRQQLIAMLGVLRRRQTTADIDRNLLRDIAQRNPENPSVGSPDLPLIRRVVTPWGESLFLIAMKPPSVRALRRTWSGLSAPRPPLHSFLAAHRAETLGLYTSNGGGGGDQTVNDLQYLGSDAFVSGRFAGLGPRQGGYQYLIRVVPDDVTKVVFVVRGHLGRLAPGTTADPSPVTITATVHDNVAAARIRRQHPAGNFEAIWYDAAGRVLTRSFWP